MVRVISGYGDTFPWFRGYLCERGSLYNFPISVAPSPLLCSSLLTSETGSPVTNEQKREEIEGRAEARQGEKEGG